MVDYFNWQMPNMFLPDSTNLFGLNLFDETNGITGQITSLPYLNSTFDLIGASNVMPGYTYDANLLNTNLPMPFYEEPLFNFNGSTGNYPGTGLNFDSNNLFNFSTDYSSLSDNNLFNFSNKRTDSNTGGTTANSRTGKTSTGYSTIPYTNRGAVTVSGKTRESGLGKSITAAEIKPGVYINKYNYVNLNGLKQDMVDIIIKLDRKAKELGYTLVLSDAFRSHAAQADGYRRKPKLCAPPYKSAHEYGAAIDLTLMKNGKSVSVYDVPEFSNYAVSLGLEWGGTWKSKKEPWHFNIRDWQARADIRDEYRRLNNLA